MADVSIRNVRTTACPIDGWLALSAGRRAADAPRGSAEPLCRTAGEPVRQGKTAVLESFSTYAELAAEGTFGAVPGTLGDLLREERVSVSAIGPGAAIAAVGTDSKVVGDYESRPRDPEALARLLEPRLLRDDLLVVDVGTVRDPEDLGEKDPDRLAGSRVDQVARIEARMAAVLDVLPPDATVLTFSLADSGRTPHLQLGAATGPAPGGGEYDGSLLGSGSTRQDGLVQVTDLMPTVLELLGVDRPTGLPGAIVTPQAGDTTAAGRAQRLADLSEAAITVQPLVVWFFNGLVIAQILLYGAAALALRNNWGGTDGRRRVLGVLRRVAVVFASVPVSTFLANLVPWWRAEYDLLAVVGAVFVWVVAIASLALLGPWRDRRLGPLGVVSGLTAGVLALDVLTGSTLQTSSLMGQQPVVAGRFYGLGNVQFALFATGALMMATSLADATLRSGRRRLAVAVVAVVGVVAVVIDGTPGIGSDFGGPPAMIPAFTLLALLVAGVRVTWRRVVLIGLGTAAGGGAAERRRLAAPRLRPHPLRQLRPDRHRRRRAGGGAAQGAAELGDPHRQLPDPAGAVRRGLRRAGADAAVRLGGPGAAAHLRGEPDPAARAGRAAGDADDRLRGQRLRDRRARDRRHPGDPAAHRGQRPHPGAVAGRAARPSPGRAATGRAGAPDEVSRPGAAAATG